MIRVTPGPMKTLYNFIFLFVLGSFYQTGLAAPLCDIVYPNERPRTQKEIVEQIKIVMADGHIVYKVKITQQEIAELIGLSPSAFGNFLNARASAPRVQLNKLEDTYGIKIDQYVEAVDGNPHIVKVNGDGLKKLLRNEIEIPEGKRQAYTTNDVARALGVSYSMAWGVLNNRNNVTPHILRTLENFFGLNKGYFDRPVEDPAAKPVAKENAPNDPSIDYISYSNTIIMAKSWRIEVGQRVRIALLASDLVTQTALAKELGVSPTTISWLINAKQNPSIELIEKISEVLNVEVSWLLAKDSLDLLKPTIQRVLPYNYKNIPDFIEASRYFEILPPKELAES